VAGILTPGQHGDCPQFIPLLEAVRIARRGQGRPRTWPGRAMADKAYSSAANRAYLRKRRITAVIPVREDQKKHRRNRSRAGGRPPAFDAGRYKERNTVERCFSKLKQFRAVATATANATICTRPLSTSHLSGYGYETPFPIYGI
jgi:transposase